MDESIRNLLEARLRQLLPIDNNLSQYIDCYAQQAAAGILQEEAFSFSAVGPLTESIVLQYGRPGFLVQQNTFQPAIPWQELGAHMDVLQACLPSVGRIAMQAGDQYKIVGTGWVFNNHIVTNRHVVAGFYAKLPSNPPQYIPLTGPTGRTTATGQPEHDLYRAYINFRVEAGTRPSPEHTFKLKKPIYLPEKSDHDVAVLAVEPRSLTGEPLPPSLRLATAAAAVGQVIAAVGHPADDPERNPDRDLRDAFFQGHYGVKRLQPGQVTAVTETALQHDCTTTGGSSGSPLLDVQTGTVLGLHSRGDFLQQNTAVPATVLAALFSKLSFSQRPATR